MDDKLIQVEFPEKFLKTVLSNALKGTFNNKSEFVADIIIANLQKTPVGMTQLLMGMYGYDHVILFIPGDEVWVPVKKISYWNIDEPEMDKRGLIRSGNIKVKVVKIDKEMKDNVYVQYTEIKKNPNFGAVISGTNGIPMTDTEEWIVTPERNYWVNDQYLMTDKDCKLGRPDISGLI
jgi:hypothetical protein